MTFPLNDVDRVQIVFGTSGERGEIFYALNCRRPQYGSFRFTIVDGEIDPQVCAVVGANEFSGTAGGDLVRPGRRERSGGRTKEQKQKGWEGHKGLSAGPEESLRKERRGSDYEFGTSGEVRKNARAKCLLAERIQEAQKLLEARTIGLAKRTEQVTIKIEHSYESIAMVERDHDLGTRCRVAGNVSRKLIDVGNDERHAIPERRSAYAPTRRDFNASDGTLIGADIEVPGAGATFEVRTDPADLRVMRAEEGDQGGERRPERKIAIGAEEGVEVVFDAVI